MKSKASKRVDIYINFHAEGQVDIFVNFFPDLELPDERILASHTVSFWYECSTWCLEEQKNCTWFSYSSEAEVYKRGPNCYLYGEDLEDADLERGLDLEDLDLVIYEGSEEEKWQMYKFVEIESV